MIMQDSSLLSEQKNPYKQTIQVIAEINGYQPSVSIPPQSKDFIYTITHEKGSLSTKIKRKKYPKKEMIKLSTILENKDGIGTKPMFPRIKNQKRKQQQLEKKKIKKLKNLYSRQSDRRSNFSVQKSLTIDTRIETDEQSKSIGIYDIVAHRKQLSQLELALSKRRTIPHQVSNSIVIQQSESQEEYDKDAVPGPGSYNYSYSQFDKKRNTNRSTEVSFLSKNSRFRYKENNQDELRIQLAKNNYLSKVKQRQNKLSYLKLKKVKIPFLSKSPRINQSLDNTNKQSLPGPFDYRPRHGMQQDLIKNIQRNFKANFGSLQKRFYNEKEKVDLIGPGYYSINQNPELQKQQNFYFKSKNKRFQ